MWEKIANFQLLLPSQYKIDQKTPTKSETSLFHYNLLNSRLKQDSIQRDRKIRDRKMIDQGMVDGNCTELFMALSKLKPI